MVANGGLGTFRFWLSKPATVTMVSAAGPSRRLSLDGGWHTLGWSEPRRVGLYPVQVTAVDWAGNRASFQPRPIVRVTAAGAAGATRSPAAASPAPVPAPALAVGAGLDDPSQATLARSLGLRLVRLGLAWTPGETAPDPAAVASLRAVPAGAALDAPRARARARGAARRCDRAASGGHARGRPVDGGERAAARRRRPAGAR